MNPHIKVQAMQNTSIPRRLDLKHSERTITGQDVSAEPVFFLNFQNRGTYVKLVLWKLVLSLSNLQHSSIYLSMNSLQSV